MCLKKMKTVTMNNINSKCAKLVHERRAEKSRTSEAAGKTFVNLCFLNNNTPFLFKINDANRGKFLILFLIAKLIYHKSVATVAR